MNDTRKRGLWRLNIHLPEAIEAALFNPRLDKLTVEPSPYGEALRTIGAFGTTAEKAVRCECEENGRKCRCLDLEDGDV